SASQAVLDAADLHNLDESATGLLFERTAQYPEAPRLREIMRCYRTSLAFWDADQQAAALSHLHSGLAAMIELLVQHLEQSRGLKRASIAKMFGVSEPDLPNRILESELYRDDALCLHASRLATSGDSRDYVVDDAHMSAARYLRSAIFRVLEL